MRGDGGAAGAVGAEHGLLEILFQAAQSGVQLVPAFLEPDELVGSEPGLALEAAVVLVEPVADPGDFGEIGREAARSGQGPPDAGGLAADAGDDGEEPVIGLDVGSGIVQPIAVLGPVFDVKLSIPVDTFSSKKDIGYAARSKAA